MPTEFLALHQDVKHKLCNTAQRDGVAVCNIWQNFLSRNLTWKNMVFGNIVAGWTVLWLVCGGGSSTNYRVPHSLLKIGCKVCKPLRVDRQRSISTHQVMVVPLMPSSNQWQLKITNVPWRLLKMWDQLKNYYHSVVFPSQAETMNYVCTFVLCQVSSRTYYVYSLL